MVRIVSRLPSQMFRRKYQAPMEAKNYTLGRHLVTFLDVQGQRERFVELRLPRNAEEEAQVKEVLRARLRVLSLN
jgi:hypothetical protein